MNENGLNFKAHTLLVLICGAGIGIAAWSATNIHAGIGGWITFAILGVAAAVAQLFPVHTPRNNAFSMSLVFTMPAVFLLPLPLIALLPVVQLLPEWLKERYPWYMVGFNASNWMLDLFAAWGIAHVIQNHLIGGNAGKAVAGVAAAVVLTVLNHAKLALIISFARGLTVRSTGLLSFESLSNEGVLAIIGLAVASFWNSNPYLVAVALAPLLLIHRSLAVQALKEEARVDPKTGLFNARHFAASLAEELGRAARFDRPLSLIMADLDLLRDINNTYGHLAGDAVLRGIAEVFRQQLRHYDVPARFGGEEFSILLPETPPDQAFEIADRIRRNVAARLFEVETSSEPIRATISMGVAGFPRDGHDMNELVHQADLAVYRAKLQGRNRVLDASDEPLLAQPEKRGPRLVSLPVQASDDPRKAHITLAHLLSMTSGLDCRPEGRAGEEDALGARALGVAGERQV